MKNASVLKRFAVFLCVLLLAFSLLTGIVSARQNSEKMRTGRAPDTVNLEDVSEFFANTYERFQRN